MNKLILEGAVRSPDVILPRLHRGRELWANVRIALSSDEIHRVLHHRYDVYIADRGPEYPGLNHEAKTLRDPEDADAILLYTHDKTGMIVAAMRILLQRFEDIENADQASFLNSSPTKNGDNYVAHVARMCSRERGTVRPQLLRLMLYAYFFGVNNGVRTAFLQSRKIWQPMYEGLGYRSIGAEHNGLVPMALNLRNWGLLRETGSPYQSILSLLEVGGE